MADTDELTALLNKIRERNEDRIKASLYTDWTVEHDVAEGDVRRLLAVVGALLAPHQPGPFVILGALCRKHANHRHFSITGTEAKAVEGCRDCAVTVYQACTGCSARGRLDQCPVRAAISRELLGKENGGA